MSKFDKILDVGIPIDSYVRLDLEFVYELCEENERAKDAIFNSVKNMNKYLFDLCGVYTSGIMPFYAFTIFVDPVTLKRDFHFTISNVIGALFSLLNDKEKRQMRIKGDMDVQILFNKLDSLDKIDNENDLIKKFPDLVNLYNDKKAIARYLSHVGTSLKTMKDYRQVLAIRKELTDEYQKDGVPKNIDEEIEKAKNFSVNSFCRDCANTIIKVLEHIDEINEYLETTKIRLRFFTPEMKDKLLLYVLYCYIEAMESPYITEDMRQKCLYFVNSCFKSINQSDFSNVTLEIPKLNKTATLKSLYQQYKQILVNHPELKVVDFSDVDFSSMTKEEIEDFTNEFLSNLLAKWELIPKGGNIFTNGGNSVSNRGKKSQKSEEEKRLEYEHLVDKYIEKKEFYGTLDPMFVIQGINTFDGYFACVFSNGIVVLDKYFDNAKTGRVSKGDAAYIMTLDQFYVLSHYGRSYLSGNNLCKRVYHRGEWQKKVLEYINTNIPNINTPLEMKKLFLTNEISTNK